METKLTAVEWFEQKLDDLDIEILQSIFEQAKEMEKEQIDNAWDRGYKQGYYDPEFEKENNEN